MQNQKKKKQTQRQRPPTPRAVAQKKKQQPTMAGLDAHASKYLKMLANPCSGPIVTPLYAGTAGAYQVRLNKAVQPNLAIDVSGTIGDHVKLDLVCAYVPGTNVYKIWYALAGAATNNGVQFQTFDFFDPANDLIDTYRTLAACTKFNPCGDYSTRSGVIGLILEPSCAYPTNGGETAASSMSKALRRDPIGECVHEFVWAPSDSDAQTSNPTIPAYSDNSGKACMTTVLCNVDALYTATDRVSVQGFFEFTGVYEWSPDYTKYGKDLSSQLPAVSRTPLNTALHYLGNIGNFAVNGFKALQGVAGNKMSMQLLSAGVSAFSGRAPRSMLSIAN